MKVNPQDEPMQSKDYAINSEDYFEAGAYYKILHYIYKKKLYYFNLTKYDYKKFRKDMVSTTGRNKGSSSSVFGNMFDKSH